MRTMMLFATGVGFGCILGAGIATGITILSSQQPKFRMEQSGLLGWGPCLNAETAHFVDSTTTAVLEIANIEPVASMIAIGCEQKHAPDLKNQDEFIRKTVHDSISYDAAILLAKYRDMRLKK